VSVPPFLLGACLAFWGWESGNLLVALPLAALVEGARWSRLRFDLRTIDYSRIADLSTVFFVGLAVVFAANRGVSHGVLAAFQWLPAALSPVILSQFLGASRRIPLSALFRYLRKLRERNPAIKDPPVDVSAAYAAVAIISAGVANARGPAYYAGVVALTSWGLLASPAVRARLAAGVLMLAAAAGAGYAGHVGLAQLQAALETWISDWQLRGFESDPYRTTTDIGTIGRLKQLDTILLRVYADPKASRGTLLLHRASYNDYVGTTWLARNAPMEALAPEADGTTWTLAPGEPAARLRIATRIERGSNLLALPPGTLRIGQLAATAARRNALGAVHADTGGDWIHYEAQSAAGIADYAAPSALDRSLPAAERAAFARLAERLALPGLPPAEAVRRVEEYFRAFDYSTWRDTLPPVGATPLGDFVTRSKSGHCEYFAAATTLLLRAAGVPARYATGFAVLEYSPLEGAYLVRARHAHAWTRAWVDGRWTDLDTTPPSWLAEEEKLAPIWERLADLARWASFRWSQRGEFKAGDEWFAVLAALAALLAWRLLRGRSLVRDGASPATPAREYPGLDSEFYRVEIALAKSGTAREAGEPLSSWVARLPAGEKRARLDRALQLHLRYRFDPLGLSREERRALRELCDTVASG
jgi:transglutaminase-like putative cysteine protease